VNPEPITVTLRPPPVALQALLSARTCGNPPPCRAAEEAASAGEPAAAAGGAAARAALPTPVISAAEQTAATKTAVRDTEPPRTIHKTRGVTKPTRRYESYVAKRTAGRPSPREPVKPSEGLAVTRQHAASERSCGRSDPPPSTGGNSRFCPRFSRLPPARLDRQHAEALSGGVAPGRIIEARTRDALMTQVARVPFSGVRRRPI
jgi:hypothetical protein